MKLITASALLLLYTGAQASQMWQSCGGNLRQLSFDGSRVCGTTINNDVWCGNGGNNTVSWNVVPGKMSEVNVWGDLLIGLDQNKRVVVHDSKTLHQWAEVAGFLEQSSTDGKQVCGVARSSDVWCGDIHGPHVKWRIVPGKFAKVIVMDGVLYGLKHSGEISVGRSYGEPKWAAVPGNAKDISFDGAELCATTINDDVWCANEGIHSAKANWHHVPGKLSTVQVNAGRYAGLSANGDVMFRST